MVEGKGMLIPSELEAKRFMISLLKNGSLKPCDIGDGALISESLPNWYNQEMFRRGQKYISDNRFGMLNCNVCGLFVLMGDPKVLEVLDLTGRSSTAEAARKRYVSTIVHMLSWYKVDLRPESNSWASLNKVRMMHLNVSNIASKKKIGFITQAEITLSTIGLIGFVLVRPQYLGIRCGNKVDREGFIHFWAVIGYMLGCKDEFNMCLLDIETIENICMATLRYIFIPMIQLETPKFKEMTKILIEGLSPFLPYMSYDNQMFLMKRIVGVPGYQYKVDMTKENICRQIFSTEELTEVKEVFRTMYKDKNDLVKMYDMFFDVGIPVIASKHREKNNGNEQNEWIEVGDKTFHWIMRSKDSSEWKSYLHDAEFSFLSKWDQFIVRWYCLIFKYYENSVGRYLCEMSLNVLLYFVRRYNNRNIARKTVVSE